LAVDADVRDQVAGGDQDAVVRSPPDRHPELVPSGGELLDDVDEVGCDELGDGGCA
jgi:hypothetical protein